MVDPRDDPVLQLLDRNNQREVNGIQSCHNLVQALKYIEQYKTEHYQNTPGCLTHLFRILHEASINVSSEFEKQLQVNIDKENQMQFNQEMEGHIEQLNCEIEKLRAYEKNYQKL